MWRPRVWQAALWRGGVRGAAGGGAWLGPCWGCRPERRQVCAANGERERGDGSGVERETAPQGHRKRARAFGREGGDTGGRRLADCSGDEQRPRPRAEQLRLLEEVARACRVESAADWKRVTHSDVMAVGGGRRLLEEHGSLHALLSALCGDYAALRGQGARARAPRGHWSVRENRRERMDQIAARLGVATAQAWRGVGYTDVCRAGGAGLLRHYGNSLNAALEDLYGEGAALPCSQRGSSPGRGRDSVGGQRDGPGDLLAEGKGEGGGEGGGKGIQGRGRSRGHWASMANQRALLEEVRRRHSVETLADWRRVTRQHVLDAGGHRMLRRYPSLYAALEAVYPDLFAAGATLQKEAGAGGQGGQDPFLALFARKTVPAGFWQEESHVARFVREVVAQRYLPHDQEAWYRISNDQVRAVGGGGLLSHMTFLDALSIAFPDWKWDQRKAVAYSKKASQRNLALIVSDLFGGSQMQP